MAGACSTNGEKRNAYRILVGEPERKRSLGIPRRRWADNIKIDLEDGGWNGADCLGLAQDKHKWRALVNALMNVRVP
jgi:hypothetical protein